MLERREEILSLLRTQEKVTVHELSEHFHCSEVTIRGVCVDMAFISVHSINFHVGLTSIGTPQMQIKRAILETTDKVFVLADSNKFGAGYLEVICPISDVYRVITDSGLKQEYVERAREENLPLELC